MVNDEFRVALQANIERINGSDVFCTLYSDRMADFESDPWPAIQLAIAILLDKPIIVACMPGREVPTKLAQVADRIIHGAPDELAEKVAAYLEEDQS